MAGAPDFASRDPLSPQFWDERFERAFTPWERGGAPAALRRFVAAYEQSLSVAGQTAAVAGQVPAVAGQVPVVAGQVPVVAGQVPAVAGQPPAVAGQPPAVLLPGCGSARELALMCAAGWDATAIDFSPVAVARARAQAGPWAARIVQADFFAYEPARPLDLVYEQAFLCALPRARRDEVARRWMALLRPGGVLAGYFFFDQVEKGPPFGITRERLDALLLPGFECLVDEAVEDSLPVFAGKERWMVWRRR